MVGGFQRVYELGRIFRNEGISTRHNPEFTSVEIYEAFADYFDMMELTEKLLSSVCEKICGSTKINYQEQEIDLKPPWRRATMHQLVQEYTGIDFELFGDNVDDARAEMRREGLQVPDKADSVGRLLNEAFEQAVEPN